MPKTETGYCANCQRHGIIYRFKVAILNATRYYCGACLPQPRERVFDHENMPTL